MDLNSSPKNQKRFLCKLIGWIVAVTATTVYLLTMEPTVSFWDCGEFIATSYKLQIGHPPGAPLYTLLAHCFMLIAGSNATVAWWSNALSAMAGGFTAMFIFWIIVRLLERFAIQKTSIYLSAIAGTACFVFCDTAWFSACESEVYSLSMLFSSAIIWAMVRWAQSNDAGNGRWLLLVALLLGLSVGVHQLSLLTIPALILIYLFHRKANPKRFSFATCVFALLFFAMGLSPYLIIPIRAAANPPINMGDPSSATAFKDYLTREQYEKAPLIYGRCFNSPVVAVKDGKPVYAKEMNMLFPRMWKQHDNAELYYTDWTGRHGKMVNIAGREYYKPSFLDNIVLFVGYQLGYMYLRYMMWNFSGRYNDQQGFGNLHRGQFITGIPFIDRLYIGTGKTPPSSITSTSHNRYFMLPLILGIIGIFAHFKRDKKGAWTMMALFLMSSLILSAYLNHPVYEPRERDYAYVLSFFTFTIWIAIGSFAIADKCSALLTKHNVKKPIAHITVPTFLLFVPLLMACQNWDDHDRSGRYVARDSAANLLDSCSENAILFTLGDNDTFPLWYMQQVEKYRKDVQIINISLLGSDSYCKSIIKQFNSRREKHLSFEEMKNMGPHGRMSKIIDRTISTGSESDVFFSHYASNSKQSSFPNQLKLCGIAYRLDNPSPDSVDTCESLRLMTEKLEWHKTEGIYLDETSRLFLKQYWNDVLLVAENLTDNGLCHEAGLLLDKTCSEIPVSTLQDLQINHRIANAYLAAGDKKAHKTLTEQLRIDLNKQLSYYSTMTSAMQGYIQYSLHPLLELQAALESEK